MQRYRVNTLWDEMEQYFYPRRKIRGKDELAEYLYRVDVEETEREIIVTAEIPGIENKEDFNIQIDEDTLLIQGHIKKTEEGQNRMAWRNERYFGEFVRKVKLPNKVKADGAHAHYRNGILELTFLKDDHPAARTIDVDFH